MTSMNNIHPAQNLTFQGHSRRLQCSIDSALRRKNLSQEDEKILVNNIKKAIKSIIRPDKFIEEGSHNSVYKITRKYVARIPNNTEIKPEELPDNLNFGKSLFSKLHNYYGEAIASLGKFQILKNVGFHKPAGVPEHIIKFLSRGQINKYYTKKYLPTFANIPQSSYDELAQDISKLNEIKLGPRQFCLFDSLNPNNIVLHNGKLFLVDEIDTNYDKSYGNTTAKLFEVFINRASKDFESPDAKNKTKLVRKIFKKIILASSKADLLHADTKEDFANWQKALKKCKIKDDANDVLNSISQIEYGLAKEDRADKINYYLNQLFINNPLKII